MPRQFDLCDTEIEIILEALNTVGSPLKGEYQLKYWTANRHTREFIALEKKVFMLIQISEELASILESDRIATLEKNGKKLKNLADGY